MLLITNGSLKRERQDKKKKKRRRSKSERNAAVKLGQLLSYTKSLLEVSKLNLESLEVAAHEDSKNRVLLEIHSVELREVRAGTSVSTTTGSIQGKNRRRIDARVSSTTFTSPAPESLQKIDAGKILIRQDVLAFVGSNYSKSIEYKDILNLVSNPTFDHFASQLTLSVKGYEKAVVFTLKLRCEILFLEELISQVVSSKNQVVEGVVLKQYITLIENQIKSRNQEISWIENSLEEDIGIADTWKSFVLNGGYLQFQ